MGYLLEEHSQIVFNGIQKKRVLLDLLRACYNNQNSNLEYHLHFLIRILIHFISAAVLSINYQQLLMQFREEAAQLLALVVVNNSIKYQALKQSICTCLLEVLAKNISNYSLAYGIIIFFYYMETNIIKEKVLPVIIRYLQDPMFQKHIYQPQPKELTDQQSDHYMAILLFNLFKVYYLYYIIFYIFII